MFSQIKENIIESLATMVGMIIIAFGLIFSQLPGFNGILGNILSIVGGFLSAVAGTWVFGKSASKKRFTSKLEIIRGQLATAIAQISHATDTGLAEEDDPRICLIRIEQSISNLSMIIHDIDQIIERQIKTDKNEIIEARQTLKDLGNSLNRLKKEDSLDIKSNYKPIIDQIEEKLDSTLQKLDSAIGRKPLPFFTNKFQKHPEINLSPEAIILANIRKRGMQFIGAKLQYNIVKVIHDELIKNREFLPRVEILNNLLEGSLKDLVEFNAISKSKLTGIMAIFYKAEAFDLLKESDEEAMKVRIKDKYFEFTKFCQLHDSFFYAISDLLKINRSIVENIIATGRTPIVNENEIIRLKNILSISESPNPRLSPTASSNRS